MTTYDLSSSLAVCLALLLLSTPITAQKARGEIPTCLVTYTVSQWGFAGWTGQRLTVYASGTAVLHKFHGQFSEGQEAGRATLTPDDMTRLVTIIKDAGFAGSEVRYAVDRAINPSKADLTFCPADRARNVISLNSTSSPTQLEGWNRVVAELATIRKRIQDGGDQATSHRHLMIRRPRILAPDGDGRA